MTRKKVEIDTGRLLHALDLRHEELLRDLEDLNAQIELALSQLRVDDPQGPPASSAAIGATASPQSKASKPAKANQPVPSGK